MQKHIQLVIFMFFSAKVVLSQAPAWQWAKSATSSSPETAWDVARDASTGNVYTGGSFIGNLSSEYGASLTSSYGSLDGFLAKYDPSGNVLWAIKIGGTNNDEIHGVATDGTGNVYVTGYFNGTADFDPGVANYTLTSSGGSDGFLAKYSAAGVFLWAVKFGGNANEDSWKMFADANGVYITGSYESLTAIFTSYGSAVTKATTVTDQQLNMYGAKYDSGGVVQWVVSGGGDKDDIGFNMVADAANVYFTGRYDEEIIFRDAFGVASTMLQDEQNNKPQVYIIAVTQAGTLLWKTNITSSTGGDMVVGWGIAQDATSLYVTGYFDGNINFKYPAPTLTQNLSAGGQLDLFLAKLSKAGNFIWNTSATGNGPGEQIGRALDVDASGNIILAGCYTNGLNYSAAGGPNFNSAGGHDVFVTAYSSAGAFLWSTKAGGNTRDYLNGLSVDNSGAIYICGEQDGGMIAGTTTLTAGGGKNVFLNKLGCSALTNNTITASQTICVGSAPFTFTGSLPTGGTTYLWQSSINSLTWINAPGTHTNQNYSAPSLITTTYFRRIASSSGSCITNTLVSNTITIAVNSLPSTALAGPNQTVCVSTLSLNANFPSFGSGTWTVLSGSASITDPSSFSTSVNGLGVGTNQFVWTIANGVCTSSSSTVTIVRNAQPNSLAGVDQTICATTVTMTAATPTAGTGIWTLLSGSGNITTPTSRTSQITSLGAGVNAFVWTVSNGTCTAATSTVLIIRDLQPTSNAGSSQTVCSTSVNLGAVSPTIGTGIWSVSSGTGTLIAPSSFSTQINGLSIGTNSFVWTVSNGTCNAATSTVTIVRNAQPNSFAGVDQTICATTATMAANTPTAGAGLWTLLSGTGNITTPASRISQITSLGTGTNVFVWTVSNGTCTAATSTVFILRDAQPTSNAGVSQTVCSSSATLSAVSPAIGSGNWSVLSGTGILGSSSSYSSLVNGLSVGTNSLAWTVSNGVCNAATSAVTIIRNAQPSSFAGNNQTLCTGNATMAATNPTAGSGIWNLVSGAGNALSPASSTSQITGLGTGTNSFVWTVSNGVCIAATSTVLIIRDAQPSANAGISHTVCSSNITLAATPPALGSGQWAALNGTSTISIPSSPGSAVTGLSAGTNTFVWSVTNGACPTVTSSIVITRDLPTTAFAGADQTVCASSFTLAATLPTLGTGSWLPGSGTTTVASLSNAGSQVTGLTAGNNSFVWAVSNGSCPLETSTVTIVRDIQPIPNVGATQTICSANAVLNAIPPTAGSGVWSLLAGTNATISLNIPLAPVIVSTGTNSFLWTVSNGVCAALSASVMIIRDEMPQSNAGSDQTICSGTSTLTAAIPTAGTGMWILSSGSGNIVSAASPSSEVTSLGTGTNSFIWKVSNGICPAATSTVLVIRDAAPSANAGSDQAVCSLSAILNAVPPVIGSGAWSTIAGSGNVNSTLSHSSQVTGLSVGVNSFVWTVLNGTCNAASSTVTIIRDEQPLSFAGANQTICATSATISATLPIAGLGNWSLAGGAGTVAAPANSESSVAGLSIGANILIWTVSNGTICPAASDTLIIQRDADAGIPDAGKDQRVCGSNALLSAVNPTIGQGEWKTTNGSAVLKDPLLSSTWISDLSPGINEFVWMISNGSCPSVMDTVIISSDEIPSQPDAGKDMLVCTDDIMLDAVIPQIGNGAWSLISGTFSIAQPTVNNTFISGLKEGIHKLKWSVTNGVCEEKADTLEITRTFTPVNPDAGTDQVLETSTAQLLATIPQAGSGTWSVLSGSAEISNVHEKSISLSKLPFGNTILRWTVENKSCPDVFDDIIIHVKNLNIPNAFSPNGDGINDRFVITSLDYYKEVKISVFNRWGNLLYHNSEYHNDWAGVNSNNENLADDTYYYIIEIPELKNFTGFIVIKRDR